MGRSAKRGAAIISFAVDLSKPASWLTDTDLRLTFGRIAATERFDKDKVNPL